MLLVSTIVIFLVGYIFITFENKFQTHKSAVALLLGAILWLLVAFSGISREALEVSFTNTAGQVFGVILFLLATMGLVEVLIEFGFFEWLKITLANLRLTYVKQFILLSVITFFLSAVLDNMTVGLVMVQVARQIFKGKNLLIVASAVVILANAGGAWSPIGDFTTLLMWLAQKFTPLTIITKGFFPAASLSFVSCLLLGMQMEKENAIQEEKVIFSLPLVNKVIIVLTLSSFSLPFFMNVLALPPYLGLLLGLGIVWLVIHFLHAKNEELIHPESKIERLLQKIDLSLVNFYIGIILAISALQALGAIAYFSHLIFGPMQTVKSVIIGSILLGFLSSVVDNISLTILSLKLITLSAQSLWVLLALTVGTGGSIFLIGSATGIIVMGVIKDLTIQKYFKIAFFPALIGYCVGVGVWLLEFFLIH